LPDFSENFLLATLEDPIKYSQKKAEPNWQENELSYEKDVYYKVKNESVRKEPDEEDSRSKSGFFGIFYD